MSTPRTTRRPLPTYADVLRAAEACFAAAGMATSLDVKRRLRATGFWALQADVADDLAHLADEHHWEHALALSWRITATYYGARISRSAVRSGPYAVYWPEGTCPPRAPLAGFDM